MTTNKKYNDRELLLLLLEAIDYSFMKPDKSYNISLTYPVIDKVCFIKKQIGERKNGK